MCHPGRPASPRRVPGRVLTRLVRLPEREIGRVALAVSALDALPLVHLVDVAVRQLAVFRVTADREVDVAVDRVGMTALDQLLDQLDDLRDRLAGSRLVIGPAQAEAIGVGDVRVAHLARQLLARHPRRQGGRVNLVVDVRYVCNECDFVALMDEQAREQREDDVGTSVSDVDPAVDGGAAGIDPHYAVGVRLHRKHLTGARVMQANRPGHGPATLPPAGASGRVAR